MNLSPATIDAINTQISAAIADRKNAAARLNAIALYCAINGLRPKSIGAACDKFTAMIGTLADMGLTINPMSESTEETAETVTA